MKNNFWKIMMLNFAIGVGWFMMSWGFAEEISEPGRKEWKLPAPRKGSRVSLEQALSLRRSSKGGFSEKELKEKQLSQILWAARGVNRANGKLTSPSAMARYAVSVYVATSEGSFIYIPQNHSLLAVSDRDIRKGIGTQDYVKTAPTILVFVTDYSKFPADDPMTRKISMASAEAGAIGENVYLQCAALKLGACFILSIDKSFIKEALNFGKDVEPLFGMPIGYAR
ncbi:MAG: SagB/ThcOx family dehydrogenase [Elusimicrobiota bacterium]|nr:SagB/ThcOx family dehydrogenase [Elusimicrobiota bacterium]